MIRSRIPKPLLRVGSIVGGIVGGTALAGIYIIVLVIMALSLPLNVIALMHFFGWEWWSALLAAAFMTVIPVVGQFAYIGLTIAGAVFLYQANFDWHSVVYPEPKTISVAAMTPEQFDQFKKNAVPQLEYQCKQDLLAKNSVDGKLPIQLSNRCECFARLAPNVFSQADYAYEESHNGEIPEAAKERLRFAYEQRCH